MKKSLKIAMLLLVVLTVGFGSVLANVPDTPTTTPQQVEDVDWSAIVAATWEGYKQNYIFCGADCGDNMGLVFDPNIGYQAVSEGVGYGLLMAVMMDDQATFDIIYDAAHAVMADRQTPLFHWRADNAGNITGRNSATDAEEDIALALIFAQTLVEGGEWSQHPTLPYGDRANQLIDAIFLFEVFRGQYLEPGSAWSGIGQQITNPSYFAPAWYRIFDAFQDRNRWQPVIQQGYQTLFATENGAEFGLAPDWSTADGQPAFDFCDSNGRPRDACKFEMTYDAIRVPWRIGIDCLWFDDPRACEWSQRSVDFLQSVDESAFALMYDMTGQPVVDYQNELMVGMWLTAALAAGDTELQTELESLLLDTYAQNALSDGYWGYSTQYYFNQSLAWFGASLRSGDFRNLYATE